MCLVPCTLCLIIRSLYLYRMFIKIYFDHKPLFLTDEIDDMIQPFVHHDDAVFIDELSTQSVNAMIHEMQQAKVHAGVFYHPDLEALWKAFYKKFTIVQAGGGLVTNEEEEVLLIFRRGKWDLPKGKLDKGESLAACALREVEEETGLQNLKKGSFLLITCHTYHEGARYILKESHWFSMKTKGAQHLVPQAAEGITEVRWVHPADLHTYYNKSFPSVVDVLQLWAKNH